MFEGGINSADINNVLLSHFHAGNAHDYGYFLIADWHDSRQKLHAESPDGTKAIHYSYYKTFEKVIVFVQN